MSHSRRFRKKTSPQLQLIFVRRKIALYYRQSTVAQVGNQSTAMQIDDVIAELKAQGYTDDDIICIDLDAGVSGTLPIDARQGLTWLMREIEADTFERVIVAAVDRLFRNEKQIDTNIFIDACQRHQVQVQTPFMTYDFNDPQVGRTHIKLFRAETEAGADYIRHHIKGRLHPARLRMILKGRWAGQGIPTGYMVDDRPKLPDGSENDNYRHLVLFEPWAAVVRQYFVLFQQYGGNLRKTWDHIERHGPYFPDLTRDLIPEGFRVVSWLKNRSRLSGLLAPTYTTLLDMFTNPVYLGHFCHDGQILFYYHHPALLDQDLFLWAYNRLSPLTLEGEPNPDYCPHRPHVRHDRADRSVPPPTFAGFIFSDDMLDHPHWRVNACWVKTTQSYSYRLAYSTRGKSHWAVPAQKIDAMISVILAERLLVTAADGESWQAACASLDAGEQLDTHHLEAQLQAAQRTQSHVRQNLLHLANKELIQELERQYALAGERMRALEAQIVHLQQRPLTQQTLLTLREALRQLAGAWERVSEPHKRDLLTHLAEYVQITQTGRRTKQLTVIWRDGTTSTRLFYHGYTRGQRWSQLQLDNLRVMIERGYPQAEILSQFPDTTWRNVVDLYAYHFNNGNREGVYKGEKRYTQDTRWEDTDEYRAQQASELLSSTDPLTRVHTHPLFSPLAWSDLVPIASLIQHAAQTL